MFWYDLFSLKTSHVKNHLSHKPFLFLSYQLPKIYLHFQAKYFQWNKIQMYLALNPFQLFLLQVYSLHSPQMLLNWKTQKTVLKKIVKKNKVRTKYPTSTFELEVWFIHLPTYFYHTVNFYILHFYHTVGYYKSIFSSCIDECSFAAVFHLSMFD